MVCGESRKGEREGLCWAPQLTACVRVQMFQVCFEQLTAEPAWQKILDK